MSIFVDTADIEQAKAAKELGWVRGITTNPILLAKSCNSAAGSLIVMEAGGRITDTQGQKYSLMMKNIVASNGKIRKDMMRVLKE